MVLSKKLTKFLFVLFFIICICLVFLWKSLQDVYYQIDRMKNYHDHLLQFTELSVYVVRMCDSLQDYILLAEPGALDNFRLYSNLIMKKQQEFFYSGSKTAEPDIHDIMQLYKDYQNFASYQVIPVIQARNLSKEEALDLYLKNRELSRQLQTKMEKISKLYSKEIDSHSAHFAKTKKNIIFLSVALFISLLLLPYVLYLLLRSFLARCIYTSQLAQYTDHAIMFVETGGNIKYINKSAQELFGLFPEMVLEKNIEDIPKLFPCLHNITQPLWHVLLNQKELLRNKAAYTNNDGRTVDLTVDYVPVFLLNRLLGVVLIARLAGEQKDKHLLLDTLERERKRISIEIHDWIARYMSTIIHALDYNLQLHKNGRLQSEELVRNLSELRSHCQNAAIEMRGIMNDIHPYLIDKVGLVSALESYINTFEKLNKIKVYIFYQDRALRVKKKDEIIIYRIIQEALSNIVKHAKATEVDINFTRQQDTLRIEIMDNGGFEGEFLAGQGLWGMRERANLMGGDVVFGYGETGFCVTLTVPLLPGGQTDEQDQDHAD
ncbi:sensor histidine kinase [Desulfurispora thermophila]|uniref:sensor histidine kinase n=1 Tax=Desulfurispora thermophila TaxID=265470 RepID=UPI00036DF7EC|nr:PAS domain-containing sensor histidine kinase [Desulfurispora thermophila]